MKSLIIIRKQEKIKNLIFIRMFLIIDGVALSNQVTTEAIFLTFDRQQSMNNQSNIRKNNLVMIRKRGQLFILNCINFQDFKIEKSK